jgi:hypothetical protein
MSGSARDDRWAMRSVRLALLAIALLASGCVSHIETLRQAEQGFSRAAELENRERYGDARSAGAVESYTSAYRISAKSLEKLIAEHSKELAADNLLCTAYTLQALALWRLGDREGAIRQSKAALAGACAAPGTADQRAETPRDHALLVALPGLARIDEASELLAKSPGTAPPEERIKTFRRIKADVTEASRLLDDAERELPPGHPLRGYFALSRMGAVRVWQVAVANLLFGTDLRDPERKAALDAGKSALGQYRQFVQCREPGADDPAKIDAGLQAWGKALGVSAAEVPPARCG